MIGILIPNDVIMKPSLPFEMGIRVCFINVFGTGRFEGSNNDGD